MILEINICTACIPDLNNHRRIDVKNIFALRTKKVEKMTILMEFMSFSIFTGDYCIHSRPIVDIAVLLFIKTRLRRAHGSLSFLYLSERAADPNIRRQRIKK